MAIARRLIDPETFLRARTATWDMTPGSSGGNEGIPDFTAPDISSSPPSFSSDAAFAPRNAQPDVTRDIYAPQLRDVGEKLNAAFQPPQLGVGGTLRALAGALVSRRNPQLGSIISGDYGRMRNINALQNQYKLIEDAINQNRAQNMNALNIENIQSEIANRASVAQHQRAQEDYWNRLANVKEEPPPKPTKPALTYDPGTGIPVSYNDENGTTWDVNDPNLPAQGKSLVATANKAHGQHVKEAADAQARAAAAANQRQQNTFTRQDVTAHDKAYVQPAEQVEKSYQMMNNAYNEYKAARAQGKELPTGAQSMLALSTHLSTTFGNVKGARVTKDMIHEHLGARSIPDSALVAVQRLTNGDVLSPDQWEAFHNLIGESRRLSWQTAVKQADRKNIPIDFLPKDLEGLGGDDTANPSPVSGIKIIRDANGRITGVQ